MTRQLNGRRSYLYWVVCAFRLARVRWNWTFRWHSHWLSLILFGEATSSPGEYDSLNGALFSSLDANAGAGCVRWCRTGQERPGARAALCERWEHKVGRVPCRFYTVEYTTYIQAFLQKCHAYACSSWPDTVADHWTVADLTGHKTNKNKINVSMLIYLRGIVFFSAI